LGENQASVGWPLFSVIIPLVVQNHSSPA